MAYRIEPFPMALHDLRSFVGSFVYSFVA